MKPFVVEMTIRTVVMAEDEAHAHCVAQDEFRTIAYDEDPEIWVVREVHSRRDLPSGWDLECLPYGSDGNTRLAELIGAKEPVQEPGAQQGQSSGSTAHNEIGDGND